MTTERLQAMSDLVLNLIGKDGHENFKKCLWTKRNFDDSVSQLNGIVEASDSKVDCLRALQHYLAAEDIQERLKTPDSNGPGSQASRDMRKSAMLRAEALRREFLATMWFAEQYDSYTEKLKDRCPPSPELEWLKQYSEAKGRTTRQGLDYRGLLVLYFVDQSDPDSASFTPEMVKKRKDKISNARSYGRWYSTLYRQSGPGMSYYITTNTRTA